MDYYNEFDPFAAKWLMNLAAAGKIPAGRVDDRSIKEVTGADLAGYRQCHFFAGCGGWPLALRIAGWPEESEIWTGSCPCQPFSSTGKRRGVNDDRHLAPVFLRLISERRPATVFGEQVGLAAGKEWLSDLRAGLEAVGYEVGAADLCSAGVGAIDIRQRLYWVAHAKDKPRPQANPASVPVGTAGGAPMLDSRLRWTAMAAPNWELPASWVVGSIDGVPERVVATRAFGNAINPWIAAEFVRAYLEAV